MARWYWKRTALAVVTGLTLSTDLPAAENAPTGSYQPNDVIVLKTQGRPDQKVTVLRSTRRGDGRVYTEVRDSVGKVFTMIDQAPNGAVDRVADVTPVGGKEALPQAKTREYEMPPASMVAAADSKRRRLFSRGDDNEPSAPTPAAEPEKEKKPGLFSRIFGSKDKDKEKDAQQQQQMTQPQTYTPPAQAYTPPAPAYTPTFPTQPYPAVARPATTPSPLPLAGMPGTTIPGAPAQMPSTPGDLGPWTNVRSPQPATPIPTNVKSTPGITTGTTRINLTPEPTPAVPSPAPATPPSVVAPPVTAPSVVAPSVIAPPVSAPSVVAPQITAPSIVAPAPSAPTVVAPQITAPSIVVPSAPSVPTAPAMPAIVVPPVPQVSIPTLPTPAPSPQSMGTPTPGISRVSHAETVTVLDEVKVEVAILMESTSAAERLLAVRSLANGHYGWRPEVKALLVDVAKRDSAPAVRAQSIQELSELGYFDPGFIAYLDSASQDDDATVRKAAKAAQAKLKPKR